MKRTINKVAVLGSGVMGSRIACHFAGVGVQVLLLDIAPVVLTEGEQTKGLFLESPLVKNRIVNEALAATLRSSPSPVYSKEVVKNITTGNFTDNMKDIAACDWVIEVVVERLDVKQSVFAEVEKYRKHGTLITSNTSGIPIHLMAEGRSEDFKKHFCGTHFFNPPRYLRLLEVIPTAYTIPAVVDFLLHYGDLHLGKTTVLAKDTPAFIANRIGVFSIMSIFKLANKLGLTIDEVDALTGPVIGRPKSATFRTADVVGIDTLVKVAKGIEDNCPEDESRQMFGIPGWLDTMVRNNWLGDKTGQGFFKKLPSANGKGEKEILTINLSTLQYEPKQKVKFPALESVKQVEDIKARIKLLFAATDKTGEFYRQFHFSLFSYISHRVPGISNELYRIDDAMMAGFGWETGAFETWDLLDVSKTVASMKNDGYTVAGWIDEMLAAGFKSFYQVADGKRFYYDVHSRSYLPIPGNKAFLVFSNFREKIVWQNTGCTLYDIGDGVLGLEWSTKMNSIGSEVLEGINKSISLAEQNFNGLVIANSGANFSAGANVAMIFMYAIEQEYDELDLAIRLFQTTMMRVRYSGIPVITAPHGLALGGGCELNLHADKICAAAETYMGLVEVGVGLIPAGGGSKEFTLRAAAEMHDDEPETNTLKSRFFNVATAKVCTSAFEGYQTGVLRTGFDEVVINPLRRIAQAKQAVLDLHAKGYQQPVQKTQIKVLGRSALGALYAGINSMWRGNYATDHDALVARKLAYIMCGGDLSEPSLVSEQYLLDLEREAFLSLCGERKTLERIQSVLKTGKPIRN